MSNVGRPMLCPVYDMLWAGLNGAGSEGGCVSHLQQGFQLRGGRRLRPNTSEIVFGVLRCTRGRPSEIVRKRSPPESPNTVRARGTDCLRNLWVPQEGAGRPQRNAHVGVCENNTFADVSSPAFLVADTQRKQ